MNLQFPSIQELWQSIAIAVKRFPLALLFAIIGCGIATLLVHDVGLDRVVEQKLIKGFLICLLALPLFIGINSLGLIASISKSKKWLLRVLGLAFLAAFFVFSPIDKMESVKFITRFIGFNLVFHLLVAFSPFLKQSDNLRFWEYNKTIFLNMLEGLFYSATAGLGLMLALLALDKLFGINIDDEIPMTIWIWLIGFVNTIYFLSHFPKNNDVRLDSIEMSKSLFILLKYVLIPLIILYFVILYAYTGKITLQWSWPQGWISKLILGFSIMGILGFLLSYPKHKQTELLQEFTNLKSRSLAFFGKYYFWILLPMCIVLLLAIQRRICEYGVTELRYFGAALAVWLTVVTLYMVFSKKKHILFIPLSLAVFIIVSVLGPLNAYQVSTDNQMRRLQDALTENNLLMDGNMVPITKSISDESAHKIRSAIDYFFETKQGDKILDKIPASAIVFSDDDYVRKTKVIDYMKIPLPNAALTENIYRSFYSNINDPLNVTGYSKIQRFYIKGISEMEENPELNGHFEEAIYYDNVKGKFIIRLNNGQIVTEIEAEQILTNLRNITSNYDNARIENSDATLQWIDDGLNYKLIFENAGAHLNELGKMNGTGWLMYQTRE